MIESHDNTLTFLVYPTPACSPTRKIFMMMGNELTRHFDSIAKSHVGVNGERHGSFFLCGNGECNPHAAWCLGAALLHFPANKAKPRLRAAEPLPTPPTPTIDIQSRYPPVRVNSPARQQYPVNDGASHLRPRAFGPHASSSSRGCRCIRAAFCCFARESSERCRHEHDQRRSKFKRRIPPGRRWWRRCWTLGSGTGDGASNSIRGMYAMPGH